MRKIVAISGGTFATFWLFVFMASLVVMKTDFPPLTPTVIDRPFLPSNVEEKLPTPPKILPKQEKVKEAPQMPTQGFKEIEGPTRSNATIVPIGNGPITPDTKWHPPVTQQLNQNSDSSDDYNGQSSAAIPVAQIPPLFPRELAQQGIQGWVKLLFIVNEKGEPINVSVVDANPKTVFNRAAIASITKWRYRPALSNGVAVISSPQEIVMDFKLEN